MMLARILRDLSCAAAVAAAVSPLGVSAASTTFTDRATFEASLPAGNFFNNFSGVPTALDAPVPSVSGSGGTPVTSYDITSGEAGVGVFPDLGSSKAIGNWQPANDLVVALTSGNVHSAGANFWLSDISGVRQAGSIIVNFSDGTSGVVPSTTSGPYGYFGVTSDTLLTSMTIVATSNFLNFSNFSTAIPEPTSLVVVATAAAAGLLGRRRSV
ncbi:MAG: PEP-CTERM sorting domain-containing protein [Lacipirellulaceae bacterium]